MARISKEDHPKILRMVEVEHRKMVEIAAEYGCTPANISALVGKLRRHAAEEQQKSAQGQSALALAPIPAAGPEPAAPDDAPRDALADAPAAPSNVNVVAFERDDTPAMAAESPEAPTPAAAAQRGAAAAALGARLAKPGFGLVMRSADGEESMTPFRSLDDLLSAIKPILRAGARSPDPVWFSLQPVDLAMIEFDAA